MIIWDQESGFEMHFNSDGQVMTIRFTFAPQDLSRLIANYRVIESLAEPWKPEEEHS
jgi:hypothetical protein